MVSACTTGTSISHRLGVEGASSPFTFGSFTDTDTRDQPASAYTVDVVWGDGSKTNGFVVPVAGRITVAGLSKPSPSQKRRSVMLNKATPTAASPDPPGGSIATPIAAVSAAE